MAEVFTVFVQLEAPKGNSPGKVIEGCFIVEDGVVILTDRRGDPVQDDNGNKYTHKLVGGDNAKQMAAILTKKLRKQLRGNSAPAGFSGPLDYPILKY